jgi:hypothetical protein
MKTISVIIALAGLAGVLWGVVQTNIAQDPGASYGGLVLLVAGIIALVFGGAGWWLQS